MSSGSGDAAVIEERRFRTRQDAAQFLRHLLLHGWSVGASQGGTALIDELW